MSLILNLSVQLRQYRREKDITLMEFSSMLGIAKSSLQSYESGNGNPTLNTVEQIGQKIHVDSGSLLLPGKPPRAVSRGGISARTAAGSMPFQHKAVPNLRAML